MYLLCLYIFEEEKSPPHSPLFVQETHSSKYSFFQSLIDFLTFPRFRGHPVKPQPFSLRTRPGNSSRVWSDDVADYRTLRCTQRCPVSLRPVCGTGDDR